MDSPLSRDAEGSAPPTASSASLPPPTKRRRTASAISDCCRTCRLRKVKCTGNPGNGPCSNCSRLELACSFVVASNAIEQERVSRTTPSHSHTEAGTLRKRAQRACSQCHLHKTKCSGDLPRCKRCEIGGLLCEYTPARRRFTNVRFNSPGKVDEVRSSVSVRPRSEETTTISPASSAGTTGPGTVNPFMVDVCALNAEDMLIRKDIILTHVDAYLNYLYSVPCLGFLHPDITYLEIQENRFPPAQAAAVCSVASFFVNPGGAGREFGKRCSQQVEMHIYNNISKFSEEALVLFALNILFNLLDGSFAKVWQCFGVASRLMIGLQLNWDVLPRDATFIQQESLRRVAWHLFGLDRLLAGGYEEYISCRAENMKIRLPCSEAAFVENRPVITERLHDKPGRCSNDLGLHGIQIRLIDLRHRIQVTTKKLVPSGSHTPHIEPSKVMADINALQNELTRLHASIHDDLRLSDQSISRYAATRQWRGYVFFHTHMAVSHIDLYRFSLPGPRDQSSIEILRKLPREFLARSQKQAVAHAMCLARFFDAIRNETKQMPNLGKIKLVGDYSVAHMSTQCLRVLLVALQYNLYQDLADHTTAPLWRGGPTDEAQIRSFIHTMFEITEGWSQIFDMGKQAHECNKAMLEEFDRNRKLINPSGMSDRNANGDKRLPGPNLILEQANVSGTEEDHRNRTTTLPVSDWWMGSTTSQQTLPSTASPLTVSYPITGVGFDVEHGPPGLPLLLQQARSLSLGINEMPLMYDADNAIMTMSEKTYWNTSDMDGVMSNGYQLMPTAPVPAPGGMPMMRMDGTTQDPSMFQQPQVPPEQQQHFIPSQQSMFLNGYTGDYTNGHTDSTTYMQQNNFG